MHIAIAGLGYVGLSLACLFAKNNTVTAVDIDEYRVDAINQGTSPIKDDEIESFLQSHPAALRATLDAPDAYKRADIIIISTPTNYDDATHQFNTSSIEAVLNLVSEVNPTATVVIKSTIPVGYTQTISSQFEQLRIMFSPEFLREGHALFDNLHPSRIVVGLVDRKDEGAAQQFAQLLCEGAEDGDIPVLITGSTEAEAIKLFANTYLALRVSFFNELDTYAESKGLDTRAIIEGVCLDPRIGDHYNNPSFGYGGYCLPKDSKQLLANYEDVPQNLIRAIVESNATRMDFIAHQILSSNPKTVGAYRITMKEGSDNFRQSSTIQILNRLSTANVNVLVYEPTVSAVTVSGYPVEPDLSSFKKRCDIIIANRFSDDLSDVKDMVYTRDLWQRD